VGRRKARQLCQAAESPGSQIIDALQPDEVETLVRLLRRIAASLNKEGVSVG
jgi:hypothetical protein